MLVGFNRIENFFVWMFFDVGLTPCGPARPRLPTYQFFALPLWCCRHVFSALPATDASIPKQKPGCLAKFYPGATRNQWYINSPKLLWGKAKTLRKTTVLQEKNLLGIWSRPINSNHCSSIARSSNSQYYNWWQKFIVSKRSYLFVLSSLHRRWYNYNKSHRQSMVAQCHWICHSPFPTSLSARQWRIIQKLKWRRTRRHHCPILPTSPSAIRFIKDQDTFGGRDSSGKRKKRAPGKGLRNGMQHPICSRKL